jgi:hypothetical protein
MSGRNFPNPPNYTAGTVIGEYKISEYLGDLSTMNSHIYAATGKGDKKYVLKWILPRAAAGIEQEIYMNKILAGVPFAVTAVRIITDPIEACGSAVFVFPCFEMDLFKYIFATVTKEIDENQVVQLSLGVLLCLSHLHGMGFVHHDVNSKTFC